MQKDTVVRRNMEEENTQGKEEKMCPLCPRGYQSSKALKEHLKTHHKGHAELEEALESVPPDICRYCGQAKAGIFRHERSCKAGRPQTAAPEQQQQQQRQTHPYAGLSNEEMVGSFQDRLTHRLKLDSKSTVPNYVRDLKHFIQHEKDLDPGFQARDWFIVGPKGNTDPRFKALRDASAYVQVLTRDGQGKKTVERLHIVWGHLHDWISEHLNQQRNDPLSEHHQRGLRAKEDRTVAHRSGTYMPGQGRKEKLDTITKRVDPGIVKELLMIAKNSRLREETMAKFAKGDFTHEGCEDKACNDCRCRLGIKSMVDAQNFLALSLFLFQFGHRLEVVMNVTSRGLRGASPALEKCRHCDGLYVYEEHKKFCHRYV